MKVTYIGHSGFLVETEHAQLLFDCIARDDNSEELLHSTGEWPVFDETKDLLVFVSHSHIDHYIHEIWRLGKQFPHVQYIIAKEVPFSSGVKERLGITPEMEEKVLRVKGREQHELTLQNGDTVLVETYTSTDEGVAFFVTCDDKIIYHAGDLYAWYWLEEEERFVPNMEKMFEKQMQRMEGRHVDVAFLPMDTRLKERTFIGLDRYLETLDVTHTFPMHFWKHYDLIQSYKESRSDKEYAGSIIQISKENEVFELD